VFPVGMFPEEDAEPQPEFVVQRADKGDPQYERRWTATIMSDRVVCIHSAVNLTPEQDANFTDNPDTHDMSPAYWREHHEEYGLGEDGSPLVQPHA